MRVVILLLISFSLLLHGTEAISFPLRNDWILNGEWKEEAIEIQNITIPSGVYSDLENANITESVLFSYNDVELRSISYENWSYTNTFQITSEDLDHKYIILTFHGLDTISEIFLNNRLLGTTDNMFIRYRFNIKDFLVEGSNELAINFQSPVNVAKNLNLLSEYKIPPSCPPSTYKGECHMNLLRKMQASFAWDWGLAVPNMGIWKDIEIESYDSLNIRDITYEMSNYVLDEDEYWNLQFSIFVESGTSGKANYTGILTYELKNVAGPFYNQTSICVKKGEAVIKVNFNVKKSDVKLWWPNGYGEQNLYKFTAKWEDVRANEVSYYEKIYLIASKSINIGFRTIELVQDQMNNGLSFYFRVNSIPIFMKGTNWIPAHILPEKSADTSKVKELLQAARDAKMNMMRLWGGGVYESDYFYELADNYGILIWHDMMFACAMYPAHKEFLDSVSLEIAQQIKRIQHHPSIAIFATNNENEVALRQNWYDTQSNYSLYANDYKKLYVKTVSKIIRDFDKNRPLLTSSPSNAAWSKDRDKWGISMDPQNQHFGDIHFYPVSTNSWRPETFHQARFASEYGFQSYPNGWKDVARENDDISELISHRQHHPLNSTLITFLVQENIHVEFESLDWEERVYLSQISQAMALKTETEVYRIGRTNFMNTMGALYWQLNDVWVAPSWSSIEYNGNYKIVHYWMQQVFAPLSIITQVNAMNRLIIYGVSDEINVDAKPMTVKMNVYKWNSVNAIDSVKWKFDMPSNSVTEVTSLEIYDYMHEKNFDVRECFMIFYLYDDNDDSNSITTNFIFPGDYQNLSISDSNLRYKFSTNKCENGQHRVTIEIRIDSPAIFIFITIDHENIKKYKLNRNGFIQVSPIQVVQLTFENPKCKWNITSDALKIKTLNKYLAL